MASIKKCLSKIKGFTRIKAEELISRTEEYQAEGMNQEDAARKVILEEYGDLNDRLNEIKSQLRVPKTNVLKYDPIDAIKKVEEEFDKKDKEEKDKAAKTDEAKDKKADIERRKQEEYKKIENTFRNNKGTYQSPITPENNKYAKYSSKGWKIHIQFKLADAERVSKFLYDNNLYFKVQNDVATYVNTVKNTGSTIYIGSAENALKVANFLKNNLSDTLENNKYTNTVDILDNGKPIYGGSGSDIYFSPGIAMRFDVAKTKHGWVGEKIDDKRVTDKKYGEHGMSSYLGKQLAGIPVLSSKQGEEYRLSKIIESKTATQEEKIKAINDLKEIYDETLIEIEKDFGKDFVGIDKIINAKYDTELTTLETKPAAENKALSKVYDVPVAEIKTNEKLYQGRKNAYSERSAKKVAEQFDPNKFDPIVVYKHHDGNTYVLSGHSRFAGMKMRNAETVPARYFEGTPEEAVDFAQNSNKLGDLQTDLENADYYRKKAASGVPLSKLIEEAKESEQKGSAQRIIDFAFLNPDGKAYDALVKLDKAEGDSKIAAQNIAQKIGRLRSKNEHLTDSHENELFDYFMKEGAPTDLQVNDQKYFVNRSIDSVQMDNSQPLNLSKFVMKSQERVEWENEKKRLEDEINEAKAMITPDKKTGWTKLKQDVINKIRRGKSDAEIAAAEQEFEDNINGIKDTYNKLLDNYRIDLKGAQDKLARHLLKERSLLEGERNQGALFQKKKESSQIENKDVDKVVERMKKVLPKFTITYNPELENAGKIQGNKIEINPFYAGTDTPIHEAGHALIDFIGYNNKVIQAGIKQLKDTDLWEKTKERYKELSEEELGKEVLAEAIGVEGAGIFDTEAKKTRFKAVLDYIFTKLKQLLGIDKNIAKSLAKRIIGGFGTKDIESAQEAAQKPKEEKKKSEPLSPEAQKIKDLYDDIKEIEDLSAVPYQDLVDAYNFVITNEEFSKTADGKKAKKEFLKRIGANFFEVASDKVKTDPNYSPEKAAKKDISGLDKLFKVLSHFNAEFPELKELSAMFNKAYFNKIKEAAEKKKVNLELAKAVIKDKNRQMGVIDWAKEKALSLIWNRNYKYFDYLDDGKGNLITVEDAKKKNLSKAQIDYLKFVRNTIAARAGVVENLEDNWNTEMQVLKTDKRFYENMATENTVAAVSSLLGNTWNINNTRIKFTNPITGKEQTLPYEEVEKILIKYGNQGLKQKVNAVRLIYKYNTRARRQLKENVNADEKGEENVLNVVKSGDYSLTSNGKLVSKFDRKRSPTRAYSTNFFSAINEYIDDTEHIQHMQPLVPIINSIEQLNRDGLFTYDEDGNKITKHGKKDNVAKWLKDWSEMHIVQRKKEFDPTVDNVVRFFRHLTSITTMMYNIPAQGMNIVLGLYNQFRQENGKSVARGMKRFFGGGMNKKLDVGYAFGALNPYAIELIKKYKVVSTDLDSNPSRTVNSFITDLGYAGTKWGEFLVQGSHFLGLLEDGDYNAFEFKKNKFGVDELVFKDSISKEKREEIEKRILDSKDMVSDVHGKYDPKDRRNIMNFELGNSVMQFKTWVPDWWRIRFGKDVGSFRKNLEWFKDGMKKDIAENGVVKAFWNNKAFMSNLKELGFITALMIFIYQDDEDEKKSAAAKVAQKALSDVMFVFDFNNAKFLVERPVASVGTLVKLIDAADHLIMNDAEDFYKGKSKYGDKGDPKIQGDVMGMMPGRKVIEMLDEDEEEK